MRLAACVIVSATLSCPALALAASAPKACAKKASTHVVDKFHSDFVAHGKKVRIVELVECEAKKSKKGKAYNDCDVSASNGQGAGDMDFKVMLNGACTKVIASFVVGME